MQGAPLRISHQMARPGRPPRSGALPRAVPWRLTEQGVYLAPGVQLSPPWAGGGVRLTVRILLSRDRESSLLKKSPKVRLAYLRAD